MLAIAQLLIILSFQYLTGSNTIAWRIVAYRLQVGGNVMIIGQSPESGYEFILIDCSPRLPSSPKLEPAIMLFSV
uniref:Secreted protein n=1 Tax=Setaria viridis TaxID=4556 RepID=A0A4U6TRL1_SETVI|nr:hypothetical protein SEVIR_7G186850v2 [Setaria viridis]